MKIHIINQKSELNQQAAQHIINLVASKPHAVLGLATGSSPLGIYDVLIKDFKTKQKTYHHVTTFNLDEYVGIDQLHSQSYYQYMQKNLFAHIDVQKENIHIPMASHIDDQNACDNYNNILSQYDIDLQILGLGSNGHIGFNEPGTPFDSKTHIIKLDAKTRSDNARFFSNLNEVPTHAITMGIENIMAAKKIILIAMGKQKAQAVYDMIYGQITTDLPASVLQQHPNVFLYIDVDAASLLPK
jgi:glucosamine-6-phosphate deaminase